MSSLTLSIGDRIRNSQTHFTIDEDWSADKVIDGIVKYFGLPPPWIVPLLGVVAWLSVVFNRQYAKVTKKTMEK